MVKNIQSPRRPDPFAPKPVHTMAIQRHALLGPNFVRQHRMVDERWQNEDLIDEFASVTELLKKHQRYQQLEKKQRKKRLHQDTKNLRHQIQEGRQQLQSSLSGDIQQSLRLILINHKDLQRAYVKMPLHEVVENINQRTFVMRKEHDRLACHLTNLGKDMAEKKLKFGFLENRINFHNEFFLQEELAARSLDKQVENSKTRLQALQVINNTYKKMIQNLRHTEKFHEPILQSLNKDIEDQQGFIAHIVYVGAPAIERLKELKHESWKCDETKRQQRHSTIMLTAEMRRISGQAQKARSTKGDTAAIVYWKKRYMRETHSMLKIKNQLMAIEKKIRQVQEVTLCSAPEKIYPTFKQQMNLNLQLDKKISLQELLSTHLKYNITSSCYKKQQILDDFHGTSAEPANIISHLQELIAEEDTKTSEWENAIKQHSNVAVVLRCSLWNIFDVLRHVHLRRDSHIKPHNYLHSYMNLPLLKYDQMEMRAVPPLNFEENTLQILNVITQKLEKLMTAHQELFPVHEEYSPHELMAGHHEEYCNTFLAMAMASQNTIATDSLNDKANKPLESPKQDLSIPTRMYLKTMSTKILDEHLKKDD